MASSATKQKTLLGFFKKSTVVKSDVEIQANAPQPTSRVLAQESSSVITPELTLASIPSDATLFSDEHISSHSNITPHATDVDMEDDDDDARPPTKVSKRRIVLDESEDEDWVDNNRTRSAGQHRLLKKMRSSSPSVEEEGSEDSSPFAPRQELSRFSHSRSSSVYSTNSETSDTVSRIISNNKAKKSNEIDKLTAAERKRLERKKDSQNKEGAFSFLIEPLDINGRPRSDPNYDRRTLHIPREAWKTFTPFERQFWEIKQYHFDTVLFFQKGKFYELYEEDARIGHSEFDLKLTQRVKMSMVGVPEMSFDFWAAKFLARGFKVGKVEQVETALGAEMRLAASKSTKRNQDDDQGKIVRRELNKVFTVGTLTDLNLLNDDHANHCISVYEQPCINNPAVSQFGITILDAATCAISVGTWLDDICRSKLETAIRQLRVKEFLHTNSNLTPDSLRVLKATLPGSCVWTTIEDYENGVPAIKKRLNAIIARGTSNCELPQVVQQLGSEGILSLGSLMTYLKQLNSDNEILSMGNFKLYESALAGAGLVIDGQTLAHIEVLENSEGGDEGSLLKLLSRCVTPFGKRMFRTWLCKPLVSVDEINDRLDAVEELTKHSTFEATFSQFTKGLPDLERMVARIHANTCKTKDFLKVLRAFTTVDEGIRQLAGTVDSSSSKLLRDILSSAPDLVPSIQRVEQTFKQPDDGKVQELYPENGMDPDYDTVEGEIASVEKLLDRKLKELELSHGGPLSYWHSSQGTKEIYQVQAKPNQKGIPKGWKQSSKTKTCVRYDVPELAQHIRQLKEAREKKKAVIAAFRSKLYQVFDDERRLWLDCIQTLAYLDCLLSLSKASLALGQPSCRPTFVPSKAAFVEFKDLRHPSLVLRRDFIPNDITLGTPGSERVILLTGPNMGGKSTLMRMTAVGVIMSQLGMLVPATSARLSPVDSILTRMGAYDNMFSAASTFKVELDECCKIMKNATSKSLLILDELGRGTSTFDGMAVATAVLHFLATKSGALSFFATHYSTLTDEFAYHPQVINMHMASVLDEEKRELIFLYKLIKGTAPSSFGTHVARLAGVSQNIVERAEQVSRDFSEKFDYKQMTCRRKSLPILIQADFAYLQKVAAGSTCSETDPQVREAIRTILRSIPAEGTSYTTG